MITSQFNRKFYQTVKQAIFSKESLFSLDFVDSVIGEMAIKAESNTMVYEKAAKTPFE